MKIALVSTAVCILTTLTILGVESGQTGKIASLIHNNSRPSWPQCFHSLSKKWRQDNEIFGTGGGCNRGLDKSSDG